MIRIRRAVASGIAAVTAAAGFGMVAASPAAAATVVMTYSCANPWIWPHDRITEITLTAPATAAPRQTVTVTVNRLVDRSRVQAEPTPAGWISVQMLINLGGAASGSVQTTRMINPPLEAGEHPRVENGTAQVTMPAAGEVTYLPGRWWFTGTAGLQCNPKSGEPVPVAARTRVQ